MDLQKQYQEVKKIVLPIWFGIILIELLLLSFIYRHGDQTPEFKDTMLFSLFATIAMYSLWFFLALITWLGKEGKTKGYINEGLFTFSLVAVKIPALSFIPMMIFFLFGAFA